MKPRSCQEVLTLLSDLLAGAIAAEDIETVEIHVAKCDSCRPLAEDFFWQHRALAEVAAHLEAAEFRSRLHALLAKEARHPATAQVAAPFVSSGRKDSSQVRPSRRWARSVIAAAGLFVVFATLWWAVTSREASNPVLAVVESADGEVHVLAGGKRLVCRVGTALGSGQGIVTSAQGGAVTLKYVDGSRLELAAGGEIAELSEGGAGESRGKLVTLSKGSLRAVVVQQAADRPMIVSTLHADARVVGTTFRIAVSVGEEASTRLEVMEGKVRLRRLLGGQSVDVLAGHYAVVASGIEMSPKPLARWSLVQGYGWSVAYDPVSESYRFSGVNSRGVFGGAALKLMEVWNPSKGPFELSYQFDVREPQPQFGIHAAFQRASESEGVLDQSLQVQVFAGGLQVVSGREQVMGTATFQQPPPGIPATVKIRIDGERIRVEINGKLGWAGLHGHGLEGSSPMKLRLIVGDVAGARAAECTLRKLTVVSSSR